MADLPIVPDAFKLVVRDERSKKQMSVVTKLLKRRRRRPGHQRLRRRPRGRAHLRLPVREGRRQEAGPAPVAVVDDRHARCARRSARCARARSSPQLEAAARSRSEADWIVGMNATRAATIRLRSSFDGAVSLGPRADADARDPRPARGGDPRVQARAVLARRRDVRRRRRRASTRAASTPAPARACKTADEATAIVDAVRGQRGTITKLDKTKRTEKVAAPLRPHVAAARGQLALRLLRAPHARRRAAPVRGAQGAHVPAGRARASCRAT